LDGAKFFECCFNNMVEIRECNVRENNLPWFHCNQRDRGHPQQNALEAIPQADFRCFYVRFAIIWTQRCVQ